MVQFKSKTCLLPTPMHTAGLEPHARKAVERALAALGQPWTEPDAVIRTDGGSPVYVVVVERTRDEFPTPEQVMESCGVTRREAQVAVLLGKRLTSHEVADELGVTVHTARRHTEQVLDKLGCDSRADVRPVLLSLAARLARRAADERCYENARRARRLRAAAA